MHKITNKMGSTTNATKATLQQRLQELSRVIRKAKIHARGMKTSNALHKATKLMDTILEAFPDVEPIPWRTTVEPKSVCQEEYLGSKGKQDHWFEVSDCSHQKPFEELTTIVIYMKETNEALLKSRMYNFLKSFPPDYKNVTVILANNFNIMVESTSRTVKYVSYNNQEDGEVWNLLIKEVKTPYVLVARDVDILTVDIQLERLIRVIESLQIPVAAGSMRDTGGHWKMGCFQTVYKNFSLKYFEGYDESFHECVFCDYSRGPFLADVQTFQKIQFASIPQNAGLFEDWFLRLMRNNMETVTCPDAMFYVNHSSQDTQKWTQFMNKWNLYDVLSWKGETIISDCNASLMKNTPTTALSPCMMKDNAKAIYALMRICRNNSFICELNCGTALGAVKFGHPLPWDVDGDIVITHADFDEYRKALEKEKFTLTDNQKETCENGYYTAFVGDWPIDVCQIIDLESAQLIAGHFKQTTVLYNGYWLATAGNPGAFVRTRYGHEIYQHANHFRHTDSDPRKPYKPGRFLPCETPGNHACLDQYNGDGNLQFKIILP